MDPADRSRLMLQGQLAFNRAEFYEAHEHWEEVWNELDDPERRWVQGLIQIATGLHKLAAGRSDICTRLLARALGKLEDAPAVLDGLDLGAARTDAAAIVQAIAKGELPDASSMTVKAITGR